MRAIWKGHIRFSLVTIPIRIYNAIDTAHKLQFNQLNSQTNNPIKYQKVDKDTGETLKEILVKDKDPMYEVDDFEGILYFKSKGNLIAAYDLNK